MKTINVIPGSPEWHAHRAKHLNASDAPTMMNASLHKTRATLLREKYLSMVRDVSSFVQERVFNPGHRFEALARPLADDIVGDMLFPIVGVLEGTLLSASFDGITVDNAPSWEHKRLNDELRALLPAGEVGGPEVGAALPALYRIQMEQQCMVSGGGQVLFTASEWDGDRLVEARHCWYHSAPALAQQIVDGWAQFEKDCAAYVLPESVEPAPVGKAPESLPALRVDITGMVKFSNLEEFRAAAKAALGQVNRNLKTDQDFADAKKAIKWCSEVEANVKFALDQALSATPDIDLLIKTLRTVDAEYRETRLDLDKVVTKRDREVKEEAVAAARKALDAHIATLNAEIAPHRLMPIATDFAGAIKGKRSIALMQEALEGLLATAKIAADVESRAIRTNLALFNAQAEGFEFLFADMGTVVHKAADDFRLLVQARIDAHKANEERKRIENEKAEHLRNLMSELQGINQQVVIAQIGRLGVLAPIQRADEPATLNLGAICARLDPDGGITLRAKFIADVLHIQPARTERGIGYYTETQCARIFDQAARHFSAMAYAGETA